MEHTANVIASTQKDGPNAWTFGCGGLAIIIAALPVAALIYGIHWLFGGTAAILCSFLLGAFTLIAITTSSAQKQRADKDKTDLKAVDFVADAFSPIGYGSFIAQDRSGNRFAVKVGGSLHLRHYKDIIGVEIEQDGSSIQKTNRGSQIDGAITGAILAGGVGMLVGGLSGSKRIEEKVHAVTLNIFTRDLHAPTVKVPFLKVQVGTSKSSDQYEAARKSAQDWYSRISAVL